MPRRSFIAVLSVDAFGIFQDWLDRLPGAVLVALEETRVAAGVAGDRRLARGLAGLLDLQQHDVVVAVEAQLPHLLDVAALLALLPEAPARAAPVVRLAELGGLGERLAVHEGEHQDVVRSALLHDRRNEAVRVPLHVVEPAHRFSVAAGSAATWVGPM